MTNKLFKELSLIATTTLVAFLHYGCSEFFEPVESTPTPTEYSYNYWLLQKTYLFEDELPSLEPEGDSVQTLYKALSDPFTRYVPPSLSEDASISLNTSIVQGDVGLEYFLDKPQPHPLYIYRVYPESPAGRVGVPRYGNILSINGVEILGDNAYSTYDSVLSVNKQISIVVVYGRDTLQFELEKEDVYAPTVFIDTLYETPIITITEFKQTTVNRENGTLGELKSYLDSTKGTTEARIIDLRNNPGGHVKQCIAMADLFVSSGPLSTRTWRTFAPEGDSYKQSESTIAKQGDSGEGHDYILFINRNSASCAEIFAAAVSEGAKVPTVGETSYGKGIGQTTWKTMGNGLAIITNLEFLTPNGNSYHKKGIIPDYVCESAVNFQCGIETIRKLYGGAILKKVAPAEAIEIQPILRKKSFAQGAYLEGY